MQKPVVHVTIAPVQRQRNGGDVRGRLIERYPWRRLRSLLSTRRRADWGSYRSGRAIRGRTAFVSSRPFSPIRRKRENKKIISDHDDDKPRQTTHGRVAGTPTTRCCTGDRPKRELSSPDDDDEREYDGEPPRRLRPTVVDTRRSAQKHPGFLRPSRQSLPPPISLQRRVFFHSLTRFYRQKGMDVCRTRTETRDLRLTWNRALASIKRSIVCRLIDGYKYVRRPTYFNIKATNKKLFLPIK